MSDKPHVDEISGVETTGHEWDGIRELNNPLPRWWVWIFYATIVFSIGYAIYYPSIPLLNDFTKGVGGYSSRAELNQELDAAAAAKAGLLARLAETDVTEIPSDPELMRFAVSGGAAAYRVNCSQCHGSGAQGGFGYPNLNDDAWLWGGDLQSLYTTIAHGIRFETDDQTRYSEMPAFGRDGILDRQQIKALALYVRSLAGLDDGWVDAGETEQSFLDNCAACHGEDGKGMAMMGAPNLTDAIWLYGSETDQIIRQISEPRHGVMPAWGDRLGDVTVKQLTLYVHQLGGGE
ncbi:cytochrome-c oxidase, cbb3-type subunit III [Marivibrio halodurans]|uniref:Cbb3-type cytochrome c oxidase subunit n=1 Tax=Marivibrio halodurans TaxID=2039722 RepID=A0A8J7S517_9PROT|nr:cytochrome-c oxidase, cbb3-type subunit III [Marivibrio halodurans]MBP5858673.1 cytochrome-c oxidase, cbb3-type subunit III [Marivibrio halodurans]